MQEPIPFYPVSRRMRIMFHLAIISGFCTLLVVGRLRFIAFDLTNLSTQSDLKFIQGTTGTFLFMLWNLMLAWIPYIVSLVLPRVWRKTKGNWYISGLFLGVWLLFLPNAPYLITDLLHLRQRIEVPFWYDMFLFFGFAFTGLMLGFAALYEVHCFLVNRLGSLMSWMAVMLSILLCSFGVYLGRFERWNSWDLLFQPKTLLMGIFENISSPGLTLAGVTILMSGFLTVGYLQFLAFAYEPQRKE